MDIAKMKSFDFYIRRKPDKKNPQERLGFPEAKIRIFVEEDTKSKKLRYIERARVGAICALSDLPPNSDKFNKKGFNKILEDRAKIISNNHPKRSKRYLELLNGDYQVHSCRDYDLIAPKLKFIKLQKPLLSKKRTKINGRSKTQYTIWACKVWD